MSSRARQSSPPECPPSATSRGGSPCSSHPLGCPRRQDLGALHQAFPCFWALWENIRIHGCQEGSLLLGKRPGQQDHHRMVWVGKALKGHLAPTPAKTKQRKQILPSWSSPPHLAISYLFFLSLQTFCYTRGPTLCPRLLRAHLPCPYSPRQHPAWLNTSLLCQPILQLSQPPVWPCQRYQKPHVPVCSSQRNFRTRMNLTGKF